MSVYQISRAAEIGHCADIWLAASIEAHAFISSTFWQDRWRMMKETYLPASTLYGYKQAGQLVGFAAIHENALAALFVLPAWQGKTVGRQLLCSLQKEYQSLTLTAYCKNRAAVCFYKKYGFAIAKRQTCLHTQEPEFLMCWKKDDTV